MNERIDMKRSTDLAPCAMSHQRGFTLIEVLIAAIVLSVGLLGLAGLQTVSLKMNQGSILRAQATALAIEITDAMRANKNDASSYAGTFSVTCNPTLSYSWDAGVAAGDLSIWQNRLACLLASGAGKIEFPEPITNPRMVTVTVTWNEERLGGSAQSFSTTTEI